MTSDLPDWPGAAEFYRRAYRLLDRMAAAGHAKPAVTVPLRKGRSQILQPGCVSKTMRDLVEALGSGDEEFIKWALANEEVICGNPC